MKVYELIAELMKAPAGCDVNLFQGDSSYELIEVNYDEGASWVSLYIEGENGDE